MSKTCFHNQSVEMNHLWYESHKMLILNLCIEFDSVSSFRGIDEKISWDAH